VFLSACETGLIDDNRGNKIGFSGFAKEFIDRGVKSVIATRWKIQDKAASEFAKVYYKNLAKYNDYGEAFYKTKENYFKEKKTPATWTSYVFIK
jgi:CHAT domain-containing protein